MIKACQSYVGHGICYDGFPEKPSCRNGEGTPPHCLNPDFFTNHLHTEDGRMLLARSTKERNYEV